MLLARAGHAEELLSFTAQVENEALAEEAILLVHCLAERTGHGWQFDPETHGKLWLNLREEAHRLKGIYHRGEAEKAVTLTSGGSDSVCDQLEPVLANAR